MSKTRAAETRPAEPEEREFARFLDEIIERYGYDFRDYARAPLKRRMRTSMEEEETETFAEFREKMLGLPECMERFLHSLSANVTSMFRDSDFYSVFRREVLPMLRTFPFIRVWNAGCSSGHEVYSLAILLMEEGLYDRCRIYATDISNSAIRQAKQGIIPLKSMKKHTANYIAAGGQRSFSEYYTAEYEHAILSSSLRRNMVFAQHNLVVDGSFNEFHLILCRNVLIYFNERLQARVHKLFHQSLAMFGYLGLGSKERMALSGCADKYQEISLEQKVFRKTA